MPRAKHSTTVDHPLAHLIPRESFAKEYISRVMDGVQDLDILRYAFAAKENTLIYGPTGPGKTTCFYAYAAADKLPLVSLQCNGAIDPMTLWGRQVINADGTIGYIESDIVTIIRHGGLVCLDEINMAPPRIMSVFYGALDDRRQVTIPDLGNITIDVHPNAQFVASMNIGYEGTRPLSQALWNRFDVKLMFDYDSAIEKRLVKLIPSILEVAKRLRVQVESHDLETPVSTNLLMEFQDHAIDLGVGLASRIFGNAFAENERSAVANVLEHFRDKMKEEVATIVKESK